MTKKARANKESASVIGDIKDESATRAQSNESQAASGNSSSFLLIAPASIDSLAIQTNKITDARRGPVCIGSAEWANTRQPGKFERMDVGQFAFIRGASVVGHFRVSRGRAIGCVICAVRAWERKLEDDDDNHAAAGRSLNWVYFPTRSLALTFSNVFLFTSYSDQHRSFPAVTRARAYNNSSLLNQFAHIAASSGRDKKENMFCLDWPLAFGTSYGMPPETRYSTLTLNETTSCFSTTQAKRCKNCTRSCMSLGNDPNAIMIMIPPPVHDTWSLRTYEDRATDELIDGLERAERPL
ncbi:hypothetical protein BJ912DRAFT_934663 [Pholiota molesta]|nr:hypothetical protein BJ912DRAFT_934663 [Pholiota molesta]